ncbi:Metallo-dependent phosphatase [Choiromyces venosus 120613-1]|uniref:Metallo-dependent phosphatase n=1 Tax=Choiromyces venosus 120613-1 TaxID=1336337 RepID=A0A3N4JS35_9PEZI|nr:Metallo-dependent phosphatase [Choiromyces venosus 120613-1]
MDTPTPISPPSRQPQQPPSTDRKKIRVVCISDTHNIQLNPPDGDVLIHAGDMTNAGSHTELEKAIGWISGLDHEVKIVIAGNHDGVTLDPVFFKEFGDYFHNNNPQSHEENLQLFVGSEARSRGVVYLNHEAKRIVLKDGRTFKVFGSPWSKKSGMWGFGYGETNSLSESLWAGVLADSEIMVTHGPPKYHLDALRASNVGCEYLRQTLWKVRPALHVFGHVHEGRGVERVKWDFQSPHLQYREISVSHISDPTPESKKLFRIDLTEVEERVETCLVNAAIVKQPWRKGIGHVGRNKAIVVDLMVDMVDLRGHGSGGGDGRVEGGSEITAKEEFESPQTNIGEASG